LDQRIGLGDQRDAQHFLQAQILVRMQVIGRHLHADAALAKAERGRDLRELGDRILGLGPAEGFQPVE